MKKLYYKFTKKYWSIISYEHAKKHNFVVQNGIFKNLKLNNKISWGKGDIASKVYGFYENKIQEKLKDIKKPILIDIGAADGFFAVGSLKSKICDICYAFEETKKSRENLYTTAEINDVNNNLSIMGAVTKDNFFSLLPSKIDFSKAIILCDIEGGEIDILDLNKVPMLKYARLLVEVHDHLVPKCSYILKQRFEHSHRCIEILESDRCIDDFPDNSFVLNHLLSTKQKQKFLNEGRVKKMKWLYFINNFSI